jgi:sigma-B regulation protein RsbU (phosphoserine phosphatase)
MYFPLFDDNMGVDLYAHMIPARGVGGDLYDAFSLDDESIFFTVGDVSGKGVPAALMMARTVTLIRSLARQNTEPHMILEQANSELARNNERCMFVTLICGVLNCRSGNLKYANAGHNFPVFVNGDGNSSLLEKDASMPLALMEDSKYETLDMNLSTDDKFVLYSDGVTEAFNIEREQFGEARLLQSASQDSIRTAEYLVEEIICDVKDYVAEAEQSDDIVVLVVQCLDTYTRSQTIKVSNNPEEYSGALALLNEFCHENGIPNETRGGLQLIFEESVINVMNYAYSEGVEGVIEILLKADSEWFSITLIDSGMEFNPLQEDYNLKAEFEERENGGMGILLIKELTDKVNYNYTDGCNRLEMWIRVK